MNTVMNNVEEAAQAGPAAVETERVEREYVRPAVNIYETKEGYVLEAELPGVSKDGLSVSLEGNLLTLEGRRTPPVLGDSELMYRESNDADFRRVFEMDPAIETAKISARLEQGILILTLPKAEAAKPHKITVA